MVAKNSHPSPNGHLQKRASGLLRIITGHFALFVNTTEGGFWKTAASIYSMFLLARGSLISSFTFSSSSIFTSYGRVLCSWCCLFLFCQLLPARHSKNVSKLQILRNSQSLFAQPSGRVQNLFRILHLPDSILLDFATPPFMATILDLNLICPYELHQLFLHNKGYIHHPQTKSCYPWSSAPSPPPSRPPSSPTPRSEGRQPKVSHGQESGQTWVSVFPKVIFWI